jgi:hypothetical protein
VNGRVSERPVTERSPASAIQDDAAINAVVSAFADDRQVRPPESGRRFGDRRAQKVNGKSFAIMSSKGHFVVELRDAIAAHWEIV